MEEDMHTHQASQDLHHPILPHPLVSDLNDLPQSLPPSQDRSDIDLYDRCSEIFCACVCVQQEAEKMVCRLDSKDSFLPHLTSLTYSPESEQKERKKSERRDVCAVFAV